MSESVFDGLLVHYAEIALKGGNRSRFEKRLIANIHDALARFGIERGRLHDARIIVDLPEGTDVDAVIEAVRPIPGIAWFAPIARVPREIQAAEAAIRKLARIDTRSGTFRVETKRSDKTYPMDSMEVNRILGSAVGEVTGRPVELKHPESTFGVRVTREHFLLHIHRHEGVGGLPVGTAGRLLSLVSGGIDSPVATWRVMRRGVQCFLLHFRSRVVGDSSSMQKMKEIGQVLSRTQRNLTCIVVPFEELQREIVANVPAEWRMIVYRRTMFRVGEVLMPRFRAKGFVTGDSISQVASQTLDNLAVIQEAASHPIYTPLAGDDKREITDLARRIGTFEISARPHTDCCSFMVAPHPVTHARLVDVQRFESACRFDPLVQAAADDVELLRWATD